MSRIGKKPVKIADKVKVEVKEGQVFIDGPKGKLAYKVPPVIVVSVGDGNVVVGRNADTKPARSLHGLTRALIANMIIGVSEGYKKELDIVGVGYRAQLEGKSLVMQLGFTHPVKYNPPDDVKIEVIKQTRLVISGIDKTKIGQVAAEIRRVRPPEPYKGTGIKYIEEQIKRKLGKAAATGAKK